MTFFDIFPTFAEAPYSYIIVPIILVSSIAGFYYKSYFYALILHPYEVYRGKRWHTLLTSALIHSNWWHLLFNSLVAYGLLYDMFGNIEQECGRSKAYILTPLLALLLIALPNIIQTFFKGDDFTYTAVGASGLSSGLFGFSFLYFPIQPIEHLFIPWIKNAFHYGIYVFIIMLLLSFIRQTKINRSLHIIAYLLGALAALFVRNEALVEIIRLLD